MQAKPWIKWAGGKTQLLPKLLPIFPKKVRAYFEPFVGGGAVFYTLAAQKRFERAVLNDWNKELVDTYRVVRDFPEELMAVLLAKEESYIGDPKTSYSEWRNPDAAMAEVLKGPVHRAARFIFLNKAGFNGLYRVNKKGVFNVPWCKKPQVKTFNEENIRACAAVLNGSVDLRHGDFVGCVEDARAGDLVYFDPPYVPINLTSNFTTYTSDGFSSQDQQRLALLFRQLADKGVAVVLSNSDTEVVRDLYAGFEMHAVQAKRNINSKGNKRGPVGELIVVGRPAKGGLL
jgi:DNA adenine methylase